MHEYLLPSTIATHGAFMENSDKNPEPPPRTTPPKQKRLSRRALLRTFTCGGLALTAGYGFLVELGWLRVETVNVSLRRLPPAFEGFKIAQISDIHFGPLVKTKVIRSAVDVVLDAHPMPSL